MIGQLPEKSGELPRKLASTLSHSSRFILRIVFVNMPGSIICIKKGKNDYAKWHIFSKKGKNDYAERHIILQIPCGTYSMCIWGNYTNKRILQQRQKK
jgi:molybdate-binding protein